MLKRLLAKCRAAVRRFEKSESGIGAIEFAILAPPFFLLMGCICETGLMFFTEYTLQTAVQDAARLVRTGQAQGGQLTASTFKTKICNLAGVLVSCGSINVYVRSDTNFANLAANMPPLITIGPSLSGSTTAANCFNPGPPSQPSAVVATYDWNFTMWGMSAMSNINAGATRRLIGFATFMNEPFPSSSSSSC
jgi:Flp pilus assembly protein TadG